MAVEAVQQKISSPSLWRIFQENILGTVGLGVLIFFLLLAALSFWITPYSPEEMVGDLLSPPSKAHLLGTDQLGRDILSRVIAGTRISLLVGLVAAFIAVVIGTSIGLIAGYFGGVPGELLMRFTDMFLVLPELPLMIILAALLGQNLWIIMVVVGITSWPGMARVVRSEVLSLKQRPFVERAVVIGSSSGHILSRHILPNVLPLIIANAILVVPVAIIAESTLSFIGLGDPTAISWGSIINDAFNNQAILRDLWLWFIPPGLGIVFLSLSFAFIGHALDETLNPRLRKREG